MTTTPEPPVDDETGDQPDGDSDDVVSAAEAFNDAIVEGTQT